MSGSTGRHLSRPARVLLKPAPQAGIDQAPQAGQLIVKGQGTIAFALAARMPFAVVVFGDAPGTPAVSWEVDGGDVRLAARFESGWQRLDARRVEQNWMPDIGVDDDERCRYWFSVDCHNRTLRYGKGEMRLETMLLDYQFGEDEGKWLETLSHFEFNGDVRDEAELWRDPVAWETPMRVVKPDRVTMADVARTTDRITVPANLTPACQQLYDNVAGDAFVLDDADFPQFSEAIRFSIETPGHWCYETLAKKADEFGEHNPDATYLRITMGGNQGESPGIPFVMEIWPSGHYSPIHDHGQADAVIKVLHGEIHVHLFAMLSPAHRIPFGTQAFHKGEVTWISARLNQFHKLENTGFDPCVTIQCYQYTATNDVHWPYFDYLEEHDGIGLFSPNSDADFLAFKAIVRAEWDARSRFTGGG